MACEEEVTDGLATERPFTVYGYIDPKADTQYVRVFPVSPTQLQLASPEPLDAVVTFNDLQAGTTITARDSIVQFFSGRYGHVFWAPFQPEHGSSYALSIRRSDGATSTAATDVPPDLEFQRGTPYTEFQFEAQGFVPLLPMDFFGQEMRLLRLTARYEVELLNVGRQVVEIPYLAEVEPGGSGWHLEVNLQTDYNLIYDALRDLRVRYGQDLIEFIALDMVPEVANPEWNPPGGVFDPDLLAEPGVFDNVENGFGFFGSAYQEVHRYAVEPCFRLIVGFAESPLACSPDDRCRYLEQCG